ncbi:MAG: hypothetical protein WCJ64_05510 [Rhodospirillaceae bacterium]
MTQETIEPIAGEGAANPAVEPSPFRTSEPPPPVTGDAQTIDAQVAELRESGNQASLAGERSHAALYEAFQKVLGFRERNIGRIGELKELIAREGLKLTLVGDNAPVNEQIAPFVKLCFGLDDTTLPRETPKEVKMARLKLQKQTSDYIMALSEAVVNDVALDEVAAYFAKLGNGVVSLARKFRERAPSKDSAGKAVGWADTLTFITDLAVFTSDDIGDLTEGAMLLAAELDGDGNLRIKASLKDDKMLGQVVRAKVSADVLKAARKEAKGKREASAVA